MANEKRLIDLDKLIAYFVEQYNIAVEDPDPVSGYVMAALRGCIAYFKTIPTVDAVEVVRCKDCKHCLETSASSTKIACSKGVNWRAVEPNHYCSYGERKDHEASQD